MANKAITSRDVDFAKWYTDVVRAAKLCDYSSVKGSMIIRPLGYAIWEEMQKYYPVDSFKSEGEAMFFYEKYFNIIYDCGCGYAAAANFIFHIFEGKEEEFQEKFGFPMYSMTDKGIDFNYELMMLKFFNFLHLVTNDDSKAIRDFMKKDMLEFKLFQLVREDANKIHRIGQMKIGIIGKKKKKQEKVKLLT